MFDTSVSDNQKKNFKWVSKQNWIVGKRKSQSSLRFPWYHGKLFFNRHFPHQFRTFSFFSPYQLRLWFLCRWRCHQFYCWCISESFELFSSNQTASRPSSCLPASEKVQRPSANQSAAACRVRSLALKIKFSNVPPSVVNLRLTEVKAAIEKLFR